MKAEHQMDARSILYVMVCQGAAILQLLAKIDEALLVGRSTVPLMDLHLDIVDGIRAVNRKIHGHPLLSLHEDLHHLVEHFINWIELTTSECQINQELNITKGSTHFIVSVMHWSNWKTEYAALNFHYQLKLTADAFV